MNELREYFEQWAKHHGFDVKKHKQMKFYLCKSTQLAWEAFREGVDAR